MNELLDFLHVNINSDKSKLDQKMFLVDIVRNGCGHSGHSTLKLTLSQELIDGMN